MRLTDAADRSLGAKESEGRWLAPVRGRRPWVVWATVLLLLGVIGIWLVLTVRARLMEVATAADHGRSEVIAGAQVLKSGGFGLSPGEAAKASADFEAAERDFSRANAILVKSRVISPLSHLPIVGRQVKAAAELTDMGSRASRIGTLLVGAVQAPISKQPLGLGKAQDPGEKFIAMLDALDPALPRISQELHGIAADRDRIPSTGLVPQISHGLAAFNSKVDMRSLEASLTELRRNEPGIRAFLGSGGSQTYLVLQQDPAELRGTGGFIGTVGFLSLDRGKMAPFNPQPVEHIDFKDGRSVLGGPGTANHVDPPYPLAYVFHLQSWALRDANWSPDFPTAAKQAEFLLARETGRKVDGVIAIDPYLVQKMLAVTGPITIPETGDVVDQNNFYAVTLSRVEVMSATRKDFVAQAAREILAKLIAVPPGKYPSLLNALREGCDQRSVQGYFHDPQLQALINRNQCGGQVQSPSGDALMVVEANVGGNKDDFWMKRRYNLQIQLNHDGSAHHVLRLHYDGLSAHSRLLTGSWGYTGWLRIYLPPGVSVTSISGAKLDPSAELNRQVLQGWFYVQFDHSTDIVVTYDESAIVSGAKVDNFHFYWQKQAGQFAVPIDLDVVLPEGVRLRTAHIGATKVASLPLVTDLSVDRAFDFEYEAK
jgi:hypothetical protein